MVVNTPNTEQKEFYVILGGPIEQQGIYENQRYAHQPCFPCAASLTISDSPSGIAMGNVREMFPIVVTCKTEQDAEAVNRLNTELEPYIAASDYVGLMREFKNNPVVTTLLTHYRKFQAILRGVETGIWPGYNW